MFVSIVRSHLLCRKDLGTGSSNHILPFAIGLFFIAEIGGTKQFMSRKKKNRVYVGLDGLDIKVNTTKILEQNYYIFYNKNNDEIGHLQAVKDGYLLHLCLPRVLRNDNTIPFCKEDFKHIENVLACVQTQLESLDIKSPLNRQIRACGGII